MAKQIQMFILSEFIQLCLQCLWSELHLAIYGYQH